MRTKGLEHETGRQIVVGVRERPGETEDDKPTYQGGCSCGFRTSNWPTKKIAQERIELHLIEHETAEPMSEQVEFFEEKGLGRAPQEPTPFGDEE